MLLMKENTIISLKSYHDLENKKKKKKKKKIKNKKKKKKK